MIITPGKPATFHKEFGYNRLTILFAIIFMVVSYFIPKLAYGPLSWLWFIITTTLICLTGFITVVGTLIALPMVAHIPAAVYNIFLKDFWNALFLQNIDPVMLKKLEFEYLLTDCQQYLEAHPALSSLYISLLILGIIWQHPGKYENKKYYAYDPRKIIDYIKEEPENLKKLLIKIIIAVTAYYLKSKLIVTLLLWYILFEFSRSSCKTREGQFDKEGAAYFGIYFLIVTSYTLFGTDKSPLDALISIITMNP